MPTEKRDRHSGAKLFIPTQTERAQIESMRRLNRELDEVEKLKAELKNLIAEQKKKG